MRIEVAHWTENLLFSVAGVPQRVKPTGPGRDPSLVGEAGEGEYTKHADDNDRPKEDALELPR